MKHGQLEGAGKYYGALFFSLINIMFNGVAELSMTVIKLPIFYKQRDLFFFPAWAFALPIWVLRVPLSLLESGLWVILTYYTIGFAPAASRYENTISRYRVSQCHWNAIIGLLFHHSLLLVLLTWKFCFMLYIITCHRFFRQLLAFFCVNQMALSLFRFIAAVGRTKVVAHILGSITILVVSVLSGVTVSRSKQLLFFILSISYSRDLILSLSCEIVSFKLITPTSVHL